MAHLKNRNPTPLSVCLDSNVIVSAIAFGGVPLQILDLALARRFHLVLGPNILDEAKKNLVAKLGLPSHDVDTVLGDLAAIASIFVPTGKEKFLKHEKDNLVVEIAVRAGCDVLVTGDKKHLLPLGKVGNLIIESPSMFLQRLARNL